MEPYQRLEHEWAAFNGLDPAGMVACSSGTAALHLALEAFRLPPGSECLVPDYTMVACPRAVALAGLTPVFVDCDERLLGDFRLARNADTDRTKAIMIVHVYGRRQGMSDVPRYRLTRNPDDTCTRQPDMMWIEDLAEAHGVRPHEATDAACWSFYRNKIVAGEEGGAVWFRDPEHAALARQLRSLGFTDAHDYDHVPRGHNYRMSNAHASIILDRGGNRWGSLGDYADGSPYGNQYKRCEIESWYDAACPPEWGQPPRDAVWVYDVRIPGLVRPRILKAVRALRAVGIEARPGFLPMSKQREFAGCRRVGGGNADRAADEVLYLPVQPGVTTPESVRAAFDVLRREVG